MIALLVSLFFATCLLLLMVYINLNLFYTVFLKMPMLSTDRRTIERMVHEINVKKTGKFYDLGCGNGSVVLCTARRFPSWECVGIEYNVAQYCVARVRNIFSQRKVIFKREDFFKVNLRDADLVYVYLFPDVMDHLETKFADELKGGAMVIANTFPLKAKEPIRIDKNTAGTLGTLYVYEY